MLRQDPIVFGFAKQDNFLQQIAPYVGDGALVWRPAHLALLSLGEDASWLKNENIGYNFPLPITQKAFAAYQDQIREPKALSVLSEAGLISIAMRDRASSSDSWSEIVHGILSGKKQTDSISFIPWRTVLTCLYGLVNNPHELLYALVESCAPYSGFKLAVHILLSNHSEKIWLEEKLTFLFSKLNYTQWLPCLKWLNLQGRSDMVGAIAIILEKKFPQISTEQYVGISQIETVIDIRRRASLLQISGQCDRALTDLNEARDRVTVWMDSLEFQAIRSALQMNEGEHVPIETHLKKINSPRLRAELIVALNADLEEISEVDQLKGVSDFPLFQIKLAKWLAKELGPEAGKELAVESAARLLKQQENSEDRNVEMEIGIEFSWVIDDLIALGLYGEALHLGLKYLELRPTDAAIMNQISGLYLQRGDLEESHEMASQCVILFPENGESHRKMAEIYEAKNLWDMAFDERQKVLQNSDTPQVNDWIAFAANSLYVNQPRLAMDACAIILEGEPSHAEALLILGKAHYAMDDFELAERILQMSIQQSAGRAEPSLLLAEIYKKTRRMDLAYDVLEQAANQSPWLVEIQNAIAALCFEQGRIEKGLAAAKTAYSHNSESLDAVKLLGEALLKSENYLESESLISSAYRHWPDDLELAYLLAQIKLMLDQAEFALPLLEKVVTSPRAEDYQKLFYVKVIFGSTAPVAGLFQPPIDEGRLKKGRSFLEEMIHRDPQNFEVRFLLSEVYSAQEEYEIALESYQKASEILVPNQNEWRQQISRGLGLVAFRLKKFDVALAAFQSIWEEGASDDWLCKLLAETHLELGLHDGAKQIAKTVIENEANWENLSWYAWLLSRLGEVNRAFKALKSALKIAPQSHSALLEFVELLLASGNHSGAELIVDHALQLGGTEYEVTKKISKAYLKCGNHTKATVMLENALHQEHHFTAESLIELLALYSYTGQVDRANDLVGMAPLEIQSDISIRVLRSDFLRAMGRWRDAKDVLLEAIPLVRAAKEPVQLYQWFCNEDEGAADFGFELSDDPAGLFSRLTGLLYSNGSYSQALLYAKQGLEVDPYNPPLLYMLFSLHKALLHSEENGNYVDRAKWVFNHYSDPSKSNPSYHSAISGLYAYYVELVLNDGDVEYARDLLTNVFAKLDHIRFITLGIRTFFLEGNLGEANQQYNGLYKLYLENEETEPIPNISRIPFDLDEEARILGKVWLAEVSHDLKDYGSCYLLSKSASQLSKKLLVAQNLLLGAALNCIQERSICRQLKIRHNFPCPDIPEDELRSTFEEAFTNLESALDDERRLYWTLKGAMVLKPTIETVNTFMEIPYSIDDITAILTCLRHSGDIPEYIVQLFEHYEELPNLQGLLALCAMENPARALVFANRAVVGNPENPQLLMILALSASANEDFNLAYKSIRNALNLWPEEPEWSIYAAELAIKADKAEEVFSHFDQAVSIEPELGEHSYQLGEALLRAGDTSHAIIMLESHQESKNNPQLLMMLGVAYQLDGQLEKALEIGERACRFDPAFSYPYKFCGQIAAEMGKKKLALKYLKKAIHANPHDAETAIALSRILVEQGEWQAGLNALKGQDLGHPFVALERAKIEYHKGDPDEAARSVEEIITKNPDDDEALMFLARMKAESGLGDEARELLKKTLQIKPEHSQAYALLGWLSYFEGQLDQAVHNYGEAIRYCPTELDYYLKLGRIFHDRREFTKALQIYNQAMKVAPTNATPFLESATIFKEIKDYVNAELMLRKAADLEPKELSIHRQLGALVALNLVHNT